MFAVFTARGFIAILPRPPPNSNRAVGPPWFAACGPNRGVPELADGAALDAAGTSRAGSNPIAANLSLYLTQVS